MEKINIEELYSEKDHFAYSLIEAENKIWDCLNLIEEYIKNHRNELLRRGYREIRDGVYVQDNVKIEDSVSIIPPCVIGSGTVIRHGAYLRGNVIIGCDCVIGNSTEVKNSIIFSRAQLPHYNYVGDSIVGYCAHLGAGAIISNLKGDKSDITLRYKNKSFKTCRRKLGALVGDFAEIGCSCVLNPGTAVGKRARVYPLSSLRGYIPEGAIYKSEGNICTLTDGTQKSD